VSLPLDIPALETERLRLRGWRAEDHGPFTEFCGNEATARFVGGLCGPDDAWRRMAGQIGHWVLRGFGSWAIEEKSSGSWVGYSGLWFPHGWPEPELMWGLAAHAHGRGYATEAARRGREYAYRQLGWKTLISCIAPHQPRLAAGSRQARGRLRAQLRAERVSGRPLSPSGPSALHIVLKLLSEARRRQCQ
jgi:RimJ/RimL family protein N-acetyltransferase